MKNETQIGFDKKIAYAWIDATAYWASQNLSEQNIRENLDSLLAGKLADTGKRSSKSKVKSILLRIWTKPEIHLQQLQKEAIRLYQNSTENEKLLLHWGMSGATYPFFFQVAEHTGRLLSITNEIRSRQVVRRLKESIGERSTLDYAGPRVVRTFVEWNILQETDQVAVMKLKEKRALTLKPELSAWFLEAFLWGRDANMLSISSINQSPALFPFSIDFHINDVSNNPRLSIFRQNVDNDMVMLKKNSSGTGR